MAGPQHEAPGVGQLLQNPGCRRDDVGDVATNYVGFFDEGKVSSGPAKSAPGKTWQGQRKKTEEEGRTSVCYSPKSEEQVKREETRRGDGFWLPPSTGP